MSAILVGAIVASVAATYQGYAGEQARKGKSKALRGQADAQRQSLARAVGQDKLADMAEAKANRKSPDASSLLFDERARGNKGAGSTMLSGGGGKPLLGSKSLMGS